MPAIRSLGRGRIGAQKCCRCDRVSPRLIGFCVWPDLWKARQSRQVRFARPTPDRGYETAGHER
jgi:hypothetical protein